MWLSLKIALASLRAHKLRTLLAVLGVFLGALALTGVQNVSKAMVRKAEIESEKMGPNLFAVIAGRIRFRRGAARVRFQAASFTISDARALMDGVPGVTDGTPFVNTTMSVKAGNTKVPCEIIAAWPNYEQVRNAVPNWGRFFTEREEQERAKVCVLGYKIAQRLFGSPEAALNQKVLFYRAAFRVVGVMEAKGRDPSGTDQDEQVCMPLSTYMRRAANQHWVSGVILNLAPGTDIDHAEDAATAIMRKQHKLAPGKPDDFSILTARDLLKLQTQALDLVQTLGTISSSISFAVGSLGILSIMILLVRMRRLEIGIRRAMGARRRDIVRQFLLEASLMSGVGGALGVIASVGLCSIVYSIASFPFVFDPVLILSALAGSALIGVFAGAYPAAQAARVEILDVLRSNE